MAATTLVIKILADASQAAKTVNTASSKFGSLGGAMRKAALPAAAIVTALGAAGAMALDAASDLQQSTGAVESVFKSSSGQIKQWGEQAASSVGLATSEYENLATIVGSQLKGMGNSTAQAATKTNDLITMGADLAATFGGKTSDAVAAVSSLLRGERDPIERYGVALKQSDINARLAAQGQSNLTGKARKAAEAQVTLALLTEQTADAHGAFARESDTAAHAQQVAAAQYENTKAALGTALLPVMATAGQMLQAFGKFAQDNAGVVRIFAVALGVFAVAVLAVNAAMSAWAAIQTVLNLALWSSPITWIIVGIVALVAILVIAYKKSATFRAIVQGAFRGIAAAASWMGGLLKIVFGALMFYWNLLWTVAKAVGRGIAAAFNWIVAAARSVWGFVQRMFVAWVAAYQSLWTKAKAVGAGVAAAFGKIMDAVRKLRDGFATVLQAIKGIFQGASDFIGSIAGKIIGWVQKVIDWIGKIKIPPVVGKILGKIGITSAPAATSPSPPPLRVGAHAGPTAPAGRRSGSSAGSLAGLLSGVTFNLAIDGQVVAAAVQGVTVTDQRKLARRILNGRPVS
jgi:hypothetical protein